MRKLVSFFLGLLFAATAHATYVQSGKTNFAGGSSVTCSVGSVTSGNNIVIGVQANSSGVSTGISSTHVPVWIQDQFACCNLYLYHGVATSSGTDTITVTLGSFVLVGAVCAEYTTPLFNTSVISTSIGATSGDVVAVATSPVSAISTNPPFTQRQAASFSGTDFLAIADQAVGSPGTYTVSFNNAGNAEMLSFLASSPPIHHRVKVIYN